MKIAESFLITWLAGLLLSSPARADESQRQQPVAAGELSLKEVLNTALEQNPSLKAARANWEAMQSRIPQARAWEDPRFGVDVERSGTTRFDTFTANEWMLGQELPLSGKNRLRAQAATAEAAASFASLQRAELDIAVRVWTAYYQYANAQALLEINLRNQELLRQFTEISRERYTLGKRTQADVLMAETELAKNLEARLDLDRQYSDAQSALNVLMNRPAGQFLPPPERLAFREITLESRGVEVTALEHRPELWMARKQIEAAKARHDLARRQWIPDPEIRVEARQFNGGPKVINEYDTGIFFNIPWVNARKYKAAISEAKSTAEATEFQLESLTAEALGLVRDKLKKIETFRHHYQIFHNRIVPLSRQSVQALRIAYTNEQATSLELLDSLRTLQETEAMEQHHLADYLTALAELVGIVGTRLHHPPSSMHPAEGPRPSHNLHPNP